MSTFEEVVQIMIGRVATLNPFGKKLRFVMDENIMHIDGTANPPVVTTADAPADATITVSVDTFTKLLSKELKPMVAFTTGKVRLKGEMSAASALQKIF